MSLAERRQKLIAAAEAVVCREGVAGATTRAIAAQAEMPLASFHYAFESHQALLLETANCMATRQIERSAQWQVSASTLPEFLLSWLGAHLDAIATTLDEHLALVELTAYCWRTSDQRDLPLQWRARRVAQVREKVAEAGIQEADRVMAEYAIALADALTQTCLATRDRAEAERLLQAWTQEAAALAP